MEVINLKTALNSFVTTLKKEGHKIALVPTMGALHTGHISLIEQAKQYADIVVCSIFVNPTQFTDAKDLEKYPRPLAHDLQMLQAAGCQAVFMPSVAEMYPEPEAWQIDLGEGEFLLEGEFRHGHFQGVTQIVKKLFDCVKPDFALFGQKDFQQVLMIKNMVRSFDLPIKIITCPIIREVDGLAMSSRNMHLSELERQYALSLSEALRFVKQHFGEYSLDRLTALGSDIVKRTKGVVLDYFVIADGNTLRPASSKEDQHLVALVAATVGSTRLIDNMILKED